MSPLDFLVYKIAYPSGILISYNNSPLYLLGIGIILIITGIYVVSELIFYFSNISNLNESTASLGTLAFTITAFIRVLIMLEKNWKLKDLINRIRRLAKKRPNLAFEIDKTEKITKKYSFLLGFFVYLTLAQMMVAPFINMYLEKQRTGGMEKNRWEFPFKLSLPYNTKEPIAHGITYGYIVLTIIPYVNPILAIDLLFMAISMHICVFFRDLQGVALDIQYGKLFILKKENSPTDCFDRNIRRFVNYHNQIIDLVKRLQDVFGGIFIVQYTGAIFTLCAQGYLFTLNVNNGNTLTIIIYLLTMILELLIYTNFGTQIMTESENLANVIWSLNWFETDPQKRFFYRQILQRCQKPCRVTALYWITSSLGSFQAVLRISYNLFTLLRNFGGQKRTII